VIVCQSYSLMLVSNMFQADFVVFALMYMFSFKTYFENAVGNFIISIIKSSEFENYLN